MEMKLFSVVPQFIFASLQGLKINSPFDLGEILSCRSFQIFANMSKSERKSVLPSEPSYGYEFGGP